MKIYIASSDKYIGKIQEDIYMRDAYRNAGLFSEIVTLKDIANISESSDVVILKSIWGYHVCYKEFIEEISHLKEKGVKLVLDLKTHAITIHHTFVPDGKTKATHKFQ